MTFALLNLNDALLLPAAHVWHSGWHDAHAAIVPEALVRLRTLDDFVRRLRDPRYQTRLAVADGDVLGFVIVIKEELYQMYVAEAARGSGVAQALMQDAQDRMRENDVRTAWLSCSIGNDRAAAFYVKTGWVNVGTQTVSVDTSVGPFDLKVWRFEKPL